MEVKEYAISKLTPYENNPRINDNAVEAVEESIRRYGWKQPIVIDRDGVIVVGHTRYKAAIRLGCETVPCVVADNLTPEEVKAYRLVDNKTNELSEWDYELLCEELDDLTNIDLSEFGFENLEAELKRMQAYGAREGKKLTEDFIAPPFSILDSRKGYWVKRKREWRDIIKDEGTTRGDAKLMPKITGEQSFAETSLLDPVLAEIIVKWFMPNPEYGLNCFDVFAGDTVFGIVSSALGANFRGIELRKEQADFNNFRMQQNGLSGEYICDDGRNVLDHIAPQTQDLLFSCPPYFDLEVYSNDDRDASNQATYEDFLKILEAAFSNAIKCLKDNRFGVIVVSDIRDKKSGFYYGFCDDIKRIFSQNGMLLYNELILVNPAGTAGVRAARCMRNRKVVKTHQNVLVFYKGDPKNIKKYFGEIQVREEEDEYAGENI